MKKTENALDKYRQSRYNHDSITIRLSVARVFAERERAGKGAWLNRKKRIEGGEGIARRQGEEGGGGVEKEEEEAETG